MKLEFEENLDPITGERGSHPVGTGLGAASVGLTGAAIGTAFGGPVGGAIGGVIGSILGAFGGRAVAENIDPTAEDAYWREAHRQQEFADAVADDFETFAPAYRVGYLGYAVYGEDHATFEDAEPALRTSYEAQGHELPWEDARPAAYQAWLRVHEIKPSSDPTLDEAHNNPTIDDAGRPAERHLGQKGEARNNPTIENSTGAPAVATKEDLEELDPSHKVLGPAV